MSEQERSPSVLIVSHDAEDLAKLVAEAEPGIDIAIAHDAREAADAYSDQRVAFGSPQAIAAALPDMTSVEWVQSSWAGVAPLLESKRRDYILTSIKGVFGAQMAEYVAGYLMAHELRIIRRYDEQRARRWWEGVSGSVKGKRIGIMGTGSIGSDIARLAAQLGMKVTGLSRSGSAVVGFEEVFPVARIDEFLPNLDYLVAVVPDTPLTDNLLDARTLALLPVHACFVNVGRANVVDDVALLAALRTGRLAGAVLDVFDEEPVPEENPLWDAPNLLITAHMAAVSHPELIVPVFLENYARFAKGQDLVHVVDFDKGY
ncbi:MAG: D-2-hydroxyacid dehydrogenase [Woeseiaceae bacterium]|nr:D-2-hydroxyacid dehydrogenase [Woeseiaceae bacterium]